MLKIKELTAGEVVKAMFPDSAVTRKGWLKKTNLEAKTAGLFIPFPLLDYAAYLPGGQRSVEDIWWTDNILTVSFITEEGPHRFNPSHFALERRYPDQPNDCIGTYFTDFALNDLYGRLETHYLDLCGTADHYNNLAKATGDGLERLQWMMSNGAA